MDINTKEMTKELKGKYIVCSTFIAESKTKHHICHVGFGEHDKHLDVFTISREGSDSPYGIFEIDHFSNDKKGHPILIVKPVCSLLDFHYEDLTSVAWIILLKTGLFAAPYCFAISDTLASERTNMPALEAFLAGRQAVKDDTSLEQKCFDLLKDGVISIKEIESALSRPAEYIELLGKIRFQAVFDENEESELYKNYPLFMKRIRNGSENFVTNGEVKTYIHKLLQAAYSDPKFAESGIGSACISFDKTPYEALKVVEWMCGRYEEIKAERKAKKKAAKKKPIS